MTATRPLTVALALMCGWCTLSFAEERVAAKEPVKQAPAESTRAPSPETSGKPAANDGEPRVQYTLIEDDATRIEELKVRGQTQRITVSPKGLKSYEILPADQGRDMSDGAGSQRGAAGKRVWHIFTF